MTDGDIENRAQLEDWASVPVLVVGWRAWVLSSTRPTLGLVGVGVVYLATYLAPHRTASRGAFHTKTSSA